MKEEYSCLAMTNCALFLKWFQDYVRRFEFSRQIEYSIRKEVQRRS